ncbi:M48 family metallopeptidase [Microcoleus sp. FACHB-68]|uniref:M48 family metallopeptidase n=1 Tax=Microcoleus sp. FACHB-68 TaxID=2692826 RepID=UPI0016874794|nr:M48 family metallopeptidase [Microcoleus sp. FACHB-68]MBD1938774.1 M48 family metallopeptidase [Microcoleus sp. FACHB-68]
MNEEFSSRNPPPSNRQLLILLAIFVGFITAIIYIIWLLVSNLVWLIPPQVEQQLAAVVTPAYEQLAQPSPAQDSLNQLLDRLETKLPVANNTKRNYRVLYIPQNTVNALALPGDLIVVYAGLISHVKSENELMMILGHELGHFTNRDHLRGIGQALLLKFTLATIFGENGRLSGIIASAVESVSSAQYSQAQERKADDFGLMLLQATYEHVAGATDFFARIDRQPGMDFAFLASHPSPRNRVDRLNRLIKEHRYQMGKTNPLPAALTNLDSLTR